MTDRQVNTLSDGIIVVNKPSDMTSFEVVRRVKKWLRPKKIGHGGTLDPFAEGLMILLINRGTKIADQFLGGDKTYEFTIRLGAETDTLDRTGKVINIYEGPPVPRAHLEKVVADFRGTFQQKVPLYAAAKINGERLYKLARKGVAVDPPSKEITVYEIELLDYEWPFATLKARCSKGTYIRQLGSDIAKGVGAYGFLQHLIRIQSGRFHLCDAWTLEEIKERAERNEADCLIIPLIDALEHLPSITVEEEDILLRIQKGHFDQSLPNERGTDDQVIRILNHTRDRLLALWWPKKKPEQRKLLKLFG